MYNMNMAVMYTITKIQLLSKHENVERVFLNICFVTLENKEK